MACWNEYVPYVVLEQAFANLLKFNIKSDNIVMVKFLKTNVDIIILYDMYICRHSTILCVIGVMIEVASNWILAPLPAEPIKLLAGGDGMVGVSGSLIWLLLFGICVYFEWLFYNACWGLLKGEHISPKKNKFPTWWWLDLAAKDIKG